MNYDFQGLFLLLSLSLSLSLFLNSKIQSLNSKVKPLFSEIELFQVLFLDTHNRSSSIRVISFLLFFCQ